MSGFVVENGRLHRWLRGLVQVVAVALVVVSPLVGGWQRTDASSLSAWGRDAYDLPLDVANALPPAADGQAVLDHSRVLFGGTGVELFGVSFVDPVVGAASVLRAPGDVGGWASFLLPLLVALLLGRVFCGWLCIFGVVSRFVDGLRSRLPLHPYEVGEQRWMRFVLLAVSTVASAWGLQHIAVHAIAYLALQHSIYGMWLLGGGGALVGWVAGLVVAGLWLGPNVYCATLCPTGAFFALMGRFRLVRVQLKDANACGPTCHSCDLRCWLSLHPSTGDAGADCDNCARCFSACPKDNLHITTGRGERRGRPLPVVMAMLLLVAPSMTWAADGNEPIMRPRLVVDEMRDLHTVAGAPLLVGVGVLDKSQTRMNLYSDLVVGGSEVTVVVGHGERPPKDARGRLQMRQTHQGPLELKVVRRGAALEHIHFDAPTAPKSTQRQTLYRAHVETVVQVGDEVWVMPVDSLFEKPLVFRAHEPRSGRDEAWGWALVGALLWSGLLSFAVATSRPPG